MRKNALKILFLIIPFVFLVPSVSALVCTNITKPLSKGSENNEVLSLQQFLADSGYLLVKPNGYFGENTRKAVSAFQKKQNITTTGFVGPLTRGRIKEISCTTTLSIEEKKATSTVATNGEEKTALVIKDTPVVIPIKEVPTIYIKTYLAVDITSESATLKGTGGIDGEKHWFEWGNTMEMTNATPQTNASTTYTYKLTGLTPTTAYYFRAVTSVASSTDRKAEIAYGDMRNFTTPAKAVTAQVLPTVSIASTGVAVNASGSAKVTWTSANTSTCSFTQGEQGGSWTSQGSLSGQYITMPITVATVFSISCKNSSGYTVTGSVTVPKIVN